VVAPRRFCFSARQAPDHIAGGRISPQDPLISLILASHQTKPRKGLTTGKCRTMVFTAAGGKKVFPYFTAT